MSAFFTVPKRGRARSSAAGAVRPGHVTDIGSFRSLALSVLAYGARHDQDSDDRLEQVTALEVQVIAVYAAEDFLCGAKRRFMLKKSAGRQALEPTTWYTQQTRARRDRKRLAELLDKARRIRFG